MTNNAITHIWDEFHDELKSFIQNKTRHTEDTDDVLQDVFMKIIKHYDKVADSNNLRAYLYAIVKNSLADYFKSVSKKPQSIYHQDFITEEESDLLNQKIAACCVKPFIEQLPEPYKQALLLTEFNKISQKELAKKLNISYSGAKSRVQRGKEKLKEMILSCCAYKSDSYGNLQQKNNTACGCS